jgi:hypothetical protein
VLQAVHTLSANAAVEWAEPDYLAYPAATTPDDTLFDQQWGLAQINAPQAWDISTGSDSVSIAMVDSGLQFNHPDLAGKLWLNEGEEAGNGLDDDNNGFVDDVNGWDFVNADNLPADDNGHGSQTAGVASAVTNNIAGIAGVCWSCKLMPVKVMSSAGVANYSDIAAGVLYAASKGAHVINVSLGGYSESSALLAAVQAATDSYNAVVVAGAGNDHLSTPFYPAAYPQVLAVAASGSADVLWGDSNFGDWVDLVAPGVNIQTTYLGSDYGPASGTSLSTAFVSGLAGLLRSHYPSWSADMTRAQLLHTAEDVDDLNPGFEGLLGSGRVDAYQALSTTPQPLLAFQGQTVNGSASTRPEPGSSVDLLVTLSNNWADASEVSGTLSSASPYITITSASASYSDIPTYATGTNITPFVFNISSSAPYGASLSLNLRVTAGGGYVVDIPITVQVASDTVVADATIYTQTWTNDRIYLINKNSGIPVGNTLTIEPGTEVRFAYDYPLIVEGTLIADGTPEQPIIFISNLDEDLVGDHANILFKDSSMDAVFDINGNYLSGSIIRHATFSHFVHGIRIESAAPFISQSQFDQVLGGAITGYSVAGLVISSNRFISSHIELWDSDLITVRDNDCTNTTFNLTGTEIEFTANRIFDGALAINTPTGMVSGNLISNPQGAGLTIHSGNPLIEHNTLVENLAAAVVIYYSGGPSLHQNNLLPSSDGFALKNHTANPIDATENWWGSTEVADIASAIYDGLDQYELGIVNYANYLTLPEPDAPAFVTSVDISPDTTLGIQTATFDISFNRPMDIEISPRLSFQPVLHDTWTVYNTDNSGLPGDYVPAISSDSDGSLWFGTTDGAARFNGSTWTVYNTSNSGLPGDNVRAITSDPDGSHWFGTNNGVATFDGSTWTVYNTSNSGLPGNYVLAISSDPEGSLWFGTNNGVGTFDDSTWTVYNTSNSGLPYNEVHAIASDSDGTHWFGTNNGVGTFDGTTWSVYNTSNSGLPGDDVRAISSDPDGTHWFGTLGNGVAKFDGSTWTVYNSINSELPLDFVEAIARDPDGSHWFGVDGAGVARLDGSTWKFYDPINSGLPGDNVIAITSDPDGSHWFGTPNGGVGVLWNYPAHIIQDNPLWLDDTHFQTTFDITSLIELGEYRLSVASAMGTDGIEIVPDTATTFTVDYAGAVSDTTPPSAPIVELCAGDDLSSLSASWSASDPQTSINLYSYAVGTTPGGSEVIDWTTTTATSFNRTNLNLSAGGTYYVAVKARNAGGLWSEAGIPPGVLAGSGVCTANTVLLYLPSVNRNP